MDIATLRDRLRRQERLDEDGFHLFALLSMVEVLRSEDEYETNRHTGVILLKTAQLRVVLEVAKAGSHIGEHTVHGPTAIYVIDGLLRLAAEDATRVAHGGEMVVVPHDRPRQITAEEETSFLWILALDQETSPAST